ncbi:MAG: hypothetical protein LRZ88_10550 [Candidatus Cloacimonetes bacterium]|nr:hypothetical protein [Candidatus Cloacimonadota bacterium]
MNIFALSSAEIKSTVCPGFPAFRHRQLMHWLYQKYVSDPLLMTDLPQDYKAWLAQNFSFALPQIDQSKIASDGSTKYRLLLADGAKIEMVFDPGWRQKAHSMCLIPRWACARACSFCATGRMRLKRNLGDARDRWPDHACRIPETGAKAHQYRLYGHG